MDQQIVGKLLNLLLNKSVLDPKAREEIEKIMGNYCSRGGVSSIKELVCHMVEAVPYLSAPQTLAPNEDLGRVFHSLGSADSLDEKIEEIKDDLMENDFDFSLDKIPEMPERESIKDACKEIIEDFFGKIIDSFLPEDKIRLQIKIERTTERKLDALFGTEE